MAGFRDRSLIRDALLAGGVIAASAVAALIAFDRGPVPRHHFGFGASASSRHSDVRSASGFAKSSVATHMHHAAEAASALPQQIGFGPAKSKKKSKDMTVVVMVPGP